ncbi:TPA: guanylate binding protein 4-like [Bos taurus]|nr:TPA: guanylate binding protein 4-like [Bos taurus]
MDPFCLVENQKCQLSVNPRALKILEQISQPAVVVAIAGLYRTTKSYLMNRLAGQNHSECLGSTVRSETRGIWMLCVHRPSKENHTLVLLDTEGLGNVETGNSKNDSCIFALAMLLSSSFVQQDEHQALEQLQYVTELTELIRTKSPPSSDKVADSTEFESFFSDLIWTVQDCMLELELDGNPITEDEYLENALKLIPEEDPRIQNSNMPRKNIRKFFPKRKCFAFDWPSSDKKLLLHIEEVLDNQLDENFQKKSEDFCSYIFTHAKPKTLREGITVKSGDESLALEHRENSAAVQKASDHYSEPMTQRLSLHTDMLQELLEVHEACEREGIAIFLRDSFKDDKRMFQKKLADFMEKKKEVFLFQNEEASVNYWLRTLVEAYINAINSGSVPCLENAVTTLAQLENSAAVQKAAGHYSEQMTKQLSLPTDTLQELLEVHTACEKEAIAVFMECSFKDEKKDFQKKFLVMIKKKKEDCLLQDEEASVKCCQAELKKLSDPLMKSISEGTFSFPGGHHRYLEARNRFKESYKLIPRKGLKSQTYLSGLAVFILKYLYTHIDKNKKLMKTEENKSRDPEQDQE